VSGGQRMQRTIIVSNRLPVTVQRQGEALALQPSIGGLATGLSSLLRDGRWLWIGWPGIPTDDLRPGEGEQLAERLESERQCRPVLLSREELRRYYHGFCNGTLWPLFHYFPSFAHFEQAAWEVYYLVNERFRDVVLAALQPGDTVWIHDYQLLLLPQMIRSQRQESTLGLFLHIPFPSVELFRLLPWRRELLGGMLGADLVGFHTYDYVRHFTSAVRTLLGVESTFGAMPFGGRQVQADVFPMGIDYGRFAGALRSRQVKRELRSLAGLRDGRKTILSVDRLDYSKGITNRLAAFDRFLADNPGYQRRVKLVLIVAPSRTQAPYYRELLGRVNMQVSSINGRFATADWTPVLYFARSFPFEKLIPLYAIADVLLVTPMRDGMNLVAKEYIAARNDRRGVLILSETAGAAQELGEALVVNPNDVAEIAAAMRTALQMKPREQRARNRHMSDRLKRYDVGRWGKDFLERLAAIRRSNALGAGSRLREAALERLLQEYRQAASRLLLLDYDGTLVPFAARPEKASPDRGLRRLLRQLAGDPANEVVLVSGRDRESLGKWFAGERIGLVAEHGAWWKSRDGGWRRQASPATDWKNALRQLFELAADRTPGSLVEEKELALAWHYRQADPELAGERLRELKESLREQIANRDLSLQEGKKVLELKPASCTKGQAVRRWLARRPSGFILAFGDDATDEDMFEALPAEAYTCKVGVEPSAARFRLDSVEEARRLLERLAALKG
jgi:trehalose 6-phosphate synthase/phosphatase